MKIKEYKKPIINAINILLVIIICTWFIPFYIKGIDFSDTCFYLVKYKYFFDSSVDVTSFSTFFTELVGSIIYHIFPSHQLMILNFTCAILYTASGLLIFYLLKDYVNHTLLLISTLGCSLLTLSYIHCYNYNTASMFNLALAIFLLTIGLFKNKKMFIAASGFIGIINIFFRLPNVLHLCIVLGIFLYCYNQNGNKFKDIVKPLFTYIFGCAVGGIVSLLIIVPTLGISKIKSSLSKTYAQFTNPEYSHSADSMFSKLPTFVTDSISLWKNYILVLAIIIIFAILLCILIKKHRKIILFFASIASCIYAIYTKSSSEIGTSESSSNADIKSTFYIILLVSFILTFAGIFIFYKTNRKFSYLCLVTAMLEIIISIGTDTGMLYYTLFLYLPIGMLCCSFWQYHKLLKKYIPSSVTVSIGTVITSFSIMLLLFSGYWRSTTFIYRDSEYQYLTEKCEITPLNGMHTTSNKNELITKIKRELEPYSGNYLITFGECNVATVISDLKPYFSTPWPDLKSFTDDLFYEELYGKCETYRYPVILFSPTTVINAPEGQTYRSNEKEQMLLTFIEENNYSLVYEDDEIFIYAPEISE